MKTKKSLWNTILKYVIFPLLVLFLAWLGYMAFDIYVMANKTNTENQYQSRDLSTMVTREVFLETKEQVQQKADKAYVDAVFMALKPLIDAMNQNQEHNFKMINSRLDEVVRRSERTEIKVDEIYKSIPVTLRQQPIADDRR